MVPKVKNQREKNTSTKYGTFFVTKETLSHYRVRMIALSVQETSGPGFLEPFFILNTKFQELIFLKLYENITHPKLSRNPMSMKNFCDQFKRDTKLTVNICVTGRKTDRYLLRGRITKKKNHFLLLHGNEFFICEMQYNASEI